MRVQLWERARVGELLPHTALLLCRHFSWNVGRRSLEDLQYRNAVPSDSETSRFLPPSPSFKFASPSAVTVWTQFSHRNVSSLSSGEDREGGKEKMKIFRGRQRRNLSSKGCFRASSSCAALSSLSPLSLSLHLFLLNSVSSLHLSPSQCVTSLYFFRTLLSPSLPLSLSLPSPIFGEKQRAARD